MAWCFENCFLILLELLTNESYFVCVSSLPILRFDSLQERTMHWNQWAVWDMLLKEGMFQCGRCSIWELCSELGHLLHQ